MIECFGHGLVVTWLWIPWFSKYQNQLYLRKSTCGAHKSTRDMTVLRIPAHSLAIARKTLTGIRIQEKSEQFFIRHHRELPFSTLGQNQKNQVLNKSNCWDGSGWFKIHDIPQD